jgi:NADH-quinone oxidoreductase subunit L
MKKDMGGLRKHMPITNATFTIASLALAGIFPLAGFWSKDEILLNAGENGYKLFMYVGLIGAFMTAAYMTRCVYLTFWGEARGNAAHHHPHESPPAITGPLVALAFLSVTAGWLNGFGKETFTHLFEPAYVANVVAHHTFSVPDALISTVVVFLGIGVSAAYYFGNLGPRGLTERSRLAHAGYAFLENKYYLDVLWTDGVVGSIKGPIARGAYWINQHVIDGVVNGAGIGAKRAAHVAYDIIDQKVVDGAVNGAGLLSSETGGILREAQTGRVQLYAAVLFGAVVVFAVALILAT